MAMQMWDAFEGGRVGSQVKEGLVDSGRKRLEIGCAPEAQGEGADLRPPYGGADMIEALLDHGRGQRWSCLNGTQAHSFKGDWVTRL